MGITAFLYAAAFNEWWSNAYVPYFMKSVRHIGSNTVDVQFRLCGTIPPFSHMPPHVQMINTSWADVARRLRENDISIKELSRGPRNANELYVWTGAIRPVLILLFHRVQSDFVGWFDIDAVFGASLLSMIHVMHLRHFDTSMSNAESGPLHAPWRTFGPLNIFSSHAWSHIRPQLIQFIREHKTDVISYGFDEWAEPAWGGRGYQHSMSSIVNRLVVSNTIHVWDTQLEPRWKENAEHACVFAPMTPTLRLKCGFCHLVKRERGSVHLYGNNGVELAMCHFQHSKRRWSAHMTAEKHSNALQARQIAFGLNLPPTALHGHGTINLHWDGSKVVAT